MSVSGQKEAAVEATRESLVKIPLLPVRPVPAEGPTTLTGVKQRAGVGVSGEVGIHVGYCSILILVHTTIRQIPRF